KRSVFAAGGFHGPDHGPGLVQGLLIFLGGVGVGDDSRSGLQICPLAFHEHGADGNAGVEVSGKIGVEDGATVNAAAGGLELFDDLHGANLGSAAERACGKAGGEGIERVHAGAQFAFERGDDVHDVGVSLHIHEVVDLHGTVFTYAPQIIAAKIHQHYMLGAFLFIVEHLLLKAKIFRFVCAARMSACNGTVFELAAGGADEHFWRRT